MTHIGDQFSLSRFSLMIEIDLYLYILIRNDGKCTNNVEQCIVFLYFFVLSRNLLTLGTIELVVHDQMFLELKKLFGAAL